MKKSYQKVICLLLLITMVQFFIFPQTLTIHAEVYNCGNLPLNSGIVYDCGSPINAGGTPGHYEGGTICSPYSGRICNICGENYSTCSHYEGTTYGGTVCTTHSVRICNICGGDFLTCPHHEGTTYGGTVCTTSYGICNICGKNYYGCPHTVGQTYGGTVCTTSSGSICNICGGNYAGCPHYSGTNYNGTICSPFAGTICSICSGNYSTCPHHAGTTYGGTVCSPSKICNICHGDYATCPHHEGTTYGGTVCSPYYISICDICGSNYANCSHFVGQTYGGTICSPAYGSICNVCGGNYATCPHFSGQNYGATWVDATPNTYHEHTSSCTYLYTTHIHTAACQETGSFTVRSNKDVKFNDTNQIYWFLNDNASNTEMKQSLLDHGYTLSSVNQVYNQGTLRMAYFDLIRFHNMDLNLTQGQYALLFAYNKIGTQWMFNYKDLYGYYGTKELEKKLFKMIYHREPKYYSMIDGTWHEDLTGNSTAFSEAYVAIGLLDVPPSLTQLITAGIVGLGLTIVGGEIATVSAGISAFGWLDGLWLYSCGVLPQVLSEMNGATQAEQTATEEVAEIGIAKLETAATEAEVNIISREVNDAIQASLESGYKYNMVENPGPLITIDQNAAGTFAAGKYNDIKLQVDTIFYRAGKAGGGRNALGQYWSRTAPESSAIARIDYAIKPQWIDRETGILTGTSPLESVYAVKIPAGTTIYEGPAGYQSGVFLGGKDQIFIKQPWNIPGVQVISETALP